VKKGFILYPRPGKHDITTSMCGFWERGVDKIMEGEWLVLGT
jgi:hypothetical protein